MTKKYRPDAVCKLFLSYSTVKLPYKEYRGLGIGTEMMKAMLAILKDHGYKQASLAVQKANHAVEMYRKVGFETVDENDEEYIMVNRL